MICEHCSKPFPSFVVRDGKRRRFNGRKFCLDCSPFAKNYAQDPHDRIVHRWVRPWTKEEFAELVARHISVAAIVRDLKSTWGPVRGTSPLTVLRDVKKLSLSTTHWLGQSHGTSNALPLKDILVENGSMKPARDRILRSGIVKHECAICGSPPSWRGKPMCLILDHINGHNRDHRVENLRFLCPSCDSQTETFCGRNKLRNNIAREGGVSRPATTNHQFQTAMVPEQVFVQHSDGKRRNIRGYLLHWGVIPYLCGICQSPPEWKRRPLTLQVDHKNGARDDDRLENLWFLCPNCHVQQPTHVGKHRGNKALHPDRYPTESRKTYGR